MHSYKTNSQHTTRNLGPQVGFLKEKNRFVEALLTYLPSSLFCYMLFSNLHSPSLVFLLSTTKVIKPHAHHQSYCDNYDNKTNPWLPSLLFAFHHSRQSLKLSFFLSKITLDCFSCCHSMIKKKTWRWWTNYLLLKSSYF